MDTSHLVNPRNTNKQAAPWVPFAWAGLAFLIIVGLMFETAASAISIWESSSTFTHGYFILPIFLWLVWRKRELLASIPSRPDWLPIPLILGSGMVWLLAGVAGIQVGQHIALVMIIIFSVWAVLGREIAKHIRFPLVFLLFLAPVGEEFVPILMEITADFTVSAIRLTGIPIYREGLFFSLPSGNWSVVEACSGIRYLIASLMLGTLYAYLNYHSTQRQLLFILLAAVVPIIANGIRAFIIVMIGHHSDMQLATGVDHLVYGWLFFGVVMFVLFSIGALFSEPLEDSTSPPRQHASTLTPDDSPDIGPDTAAPLATTARSGHFAGYAMLVALCVAAWPAWTMAMNWSFDTTTLEVSTIDSILPQGKPLESEVLNGSNDPSLWQPHMNGYDAHLAVSRKQDQLPSVDSQAFVYVSQSQGKELISSSNVLVKSEDAVWRITQRTFSNLESISHGTLPLEKHIIESNTTRLLVWRWYSVGGVFTTSSVKAKLLEARDKLLFRQSHGVMYLLQTNAQHPDAEQAMATAALAIVDPT